MGKESVVSTRDIEKMVNTANIATKRPSPKNNQIPANKYNAQLGKITKRKIFKIQL